MAAPAAIGRGTPTTAGRLPQIAVRSSPRSPTALRFDVFGTPGNTPAILLLGHRRSEADPLGVHVDLTRPFVEFSATTDAFGEAHVELDLPEHAHLLGHRLLAQWFVRDAGAGKLGFCATPALEFELAER